MTKKPTPGPWTTAGPKVYGRIPYALVHVCTMDWSDAANPSAEDALNTDLILAAGTSAHSLYESGYDGLEAVKALPGLLETLKRFIAAIGREAFDPPGDDSPTLAEVIVEADALLDRLTKKGDTR